MEKLKSEISPEEYKKKLLTVAGELFKGKVPNYFLEYLDNDEIESARVSLLGAIDAFVFGKNISDEEAKTKYEILGFDPEEASRIRNLSKANKRRSQ